MTETETETETEAAASRHGVIVLRVGEIFLKGKNRNRFHRMFVKHARRLVADLPGVRVDSAYLRAIVRTPPEHKRACLERLVRLFGLASMSPADETHADVDALADHAIAAARALPGDASFKIETKRRDKAFRMNSQQLSAELGHRVIEATGLRVNVQNPDHTIRVEVDRDACYVFSERVDGPGGLPVGVSGNVGLLLSGGIDSPVAGWSAMRRGCHVSAIYFHSFPYTGDKTKEKVLDLARLLARWQGKLPVSVVHFTDVQKRLREGIPGELAVVAYRRMMLRAAERIAREDSASALVTGENLGQVASQTLDNIGTIASVTSMPILRPLIAYDKQEIITQARRIGTFETSILPYDDCCNLFVPKHPATRATVERMSDVEANLDIPAMVDELVAGIERVVVSP